VMLMADGSAHIALFAGDVIDSLYQDTPAETGGHLDFMDKSGQVVHASDYQYDGRILQLLDAGDTDWQAMDAAPVAWCAVASQCDQQWLPHRSCLGQWACVSNDCRGKSLW
jgi:hypothetical protein